jgi:hypothetical protein
MASQWPQSTFKNSLTVTSTKESPASPFEKVTNQKHYLLLEKLTAVNRYFLSNDDVTD